MERQIGGATNSNFIQEASRPRRWGTHVPKKHLSRVRIQASFILKVEGVESNISWLRPDSRGETLISSFLPSFTGGPGQDASRELNKGILA